MQWREQEEQARLTALQAALEEGERSGRSEYSLPDILAELDDETE